MGGDELACNWELRVAIVDRAQVLCKFMVLFEPGLIDVEVATSGAPNTVTYYKIGGGACESKPHLGGLFLSMSDGVGGGARTSVEQPTVAGERWGLLRYCSSGKSRPVSHGNY